MLMKFLIISVEFGAYGKISESVGVGSFLAGCFGGASGERWSSSVGL